MIKFIQRDKIKDEDWNQLISKLTYNSVYSHSWYMDALAENWMIAQDEKGKNIMLIPYKSKAGVKLIYQPFFSREIVCSLDERTTPASIIEKLPNAFRQVEFALRDIRGIDPKKFKIEKWNHQILSLNDTYTSIAKKYHDNAKRLLKKANTAELKLVETGNVKSVIDVFRKSKGHELKDIKEADYKKLEKLMKTALNNDNGKCYSVVSKSGELLAGGYFFKSNGRLTYLKGSATEKGKKEGAMYFMFDELIKENAGHLSELDFGGSRIPAVATFYKKFGAADSEYYFVKHQNLPLYFKLLKKAGKILRK